ncbi:MAG: hypothetical protein C0598_04270 [Marinilabiliales bacterium]|nr:MAG: hypothetical protein C0598_04270 [Marinilabiliales bacterium]
MEIIFWIIIVFFLLGYAFRIFLRYGLPWLLGRFIRNQQNKHSGFSSSGFNSQYQKPEGEIKIKTNKKPNQHKDSQDDSFGEYVDFEDVD